MTMRTTPSSGLNHANYIPENTAPQDIGEVLSQARIRFSKNPEIIGTIIDIEKKLQGVPEGIKLQVASTLDKLVRAHDVSASATMLTRTMAIFLDTGSVRTIQ